MPSKEEYLDKMAEMVLEMEDEDIADLCREYLAEGYDPKEGFLMALLRE